METSLESINEAANDLLVVRLQIKDLEEQYQAFLDSNPQLQALTALLESSKMQKAELQNNLLKVMVDNRLKSWKTPEATFSQATRRTASVVPAYKAVIEKQLKAGQEVEGWTLNTTEFISIRSNPKQ